MRVARSVCLILLLAAGLGASAGAAETHPFSIHDMLAMDRISEHQVSPDGKSVVFVLRTDRPGGQPRPDRPLAGPGRRRRAAAAHGPPGRRLQPGVVARRPPDLLPVHPLRLLAGLADRRRRRRGRAGHPPAAGRVEPADLPGRQVSGLLPGGLPRRRDDPGNGRPPGEAGEAAGLRHDLRPPLRPPLGHLAGRPAQPRVRPARRRRRAGGRDGEDGLRQPLQAVRRRGGAGVHARTARASSSPPRTPGGRKPGPPTTTSSSPRSTAPRRPAT